MPKQNTTLTFSFAAIAFMVLVLLVLLGFVIYFLIRQTVENYKEKKRIKERELYALQPEPIKVGAFSFPSANVRNIMLPSDLITDQLMVTPVISRQWQGVY